MNLYLLEEDRYCQEMAERVEPALSRARVTRFLRTPDGKTLHAEFYRAEQPRAGVVIVHGFTETTEKYRELVWYFLNQGLSVYLYDGRGHGRSSRETADSSVVHIDDFSTYVRDLHQVVRDVALPENGGRPLWLFAHSMGGAVAALYLEQHPGNFARAALSSPMIRPRTYVPGSVARAVADRMVRRGRGEERIFIFRDGSEEEEFDQSACDSRGRFDYYAEKRTKNPRLRTSGGSWGWLAAALRASDELIHPENVAKIRIPVLLLQAGRDRYVSTAAQEKFVNRLPDGRIARYPKAKHELYRAENALLADYMEKLLGFYA